MRYLEKIFTGRNQCDVFYYKIVSISRWTLYLAIVKGDEFTCKKLFLDKE